MIIINFKEEGKELDKFLEKISSYNLLNNLSPGAVFCFLAYKLCGVTLIANSIIESLFVYYFVGMVISRVGSIFIEPVLEKVKFVKKSEYSDYINSSMKDPKIDILSETNNTYRTIVSLCIVVALTKIAVYLFHHFNWFANNYKWILIILLFVIFILSYRKQTKYIRNRVDIVKKREAENNSNS